MVNIPRSAQAWLFGPAQVLADCGAANAAAGGNAPITHSIAPLEAQDFFDYTHG